MFCLERKCSFLNFFNYCQSVALHLVGRAEAMRAVYTAEIYYCAGFSSLLPTLSSEMATAFLTSCGPATIVVVQATDDPHDH
jgi:hypothetical protein